MRKITLLTVVIVLCLSLISTYALSGCAAEPVEQPADEQIVEDPEEPADEPAGEPVEEELMFQDEVFQTPYKIGFSAPYMDAPYDSAFWRNWHKKEAYIEWEFYIADAQSDASNQFNQIQDLAARGLDGLFIKPFDSRGVVPVINEVWERSDKTLPIITHAAGTEPSQLESLVAHTGPDYYLQGRAVGETWVQYIEENNIEKMNYVMILGVAGQDIVTMRKEGMLDVLEEKGVSDRFNLLGEQYGDWMNDLGQTVMENFLTTFGDEIDMVYAQNDDMGIGAINAIRNAGYEKGDILVNSIDAGYEGVKLIEEGWMTFIIMQSPAFEVDIAWEVMGDVLQGKEVEFYNYIESPYISEENVDEWLPKIAEIWGVDE